MTPALPRVALQLWIVLFIVFFGAEVVHLEPSLRVATQVLYGVPLAAWAAWRLRGPLDRLDWTVIGVLAVYVIVSIASVDRTESLGTVGLATAYAALFLVLRREASGPLRRSIIAAVSVAISVTLTYNAWLLVDEKLEWLRRFGAAPFEAFTVFPWQSANALPVVVLLGMPALAWLSPGFIRSTLTFLVALSALVVVPLSVGRAGWLGLAVAGAVFGVISPTVTRRLPTSPRRRIALAAGGVVVTAAVAVAVVPRLTQALAETGRTLLWSQGVAMVASDPILGTGPGTHSWARLAFSPQEASRLAVPLVHNATLQTLIDGGVVLAVALGVALVVWLRSIPRGAMRLTGNRVAFAVLIGWAASTLLDDFSYLPSLTALVLASAAFLAPIPAALDGPRERRSIAAVSALVAIGLLSTPFIAAVDQARSDAQSGRTAMVDGRYDDAVQAFRSAVTSHPELGGPWLGLGMALAYAGDSSGATQAYRQASAVSPGDPRGYGAAAALVANQEERIRLLRTASQRSFGDPQYAVRLGIELADAGREKEAAAAWGDAVALRPSVVGLLPYRTSGVDEGAVLSLAMAAVASEPLPGSVENFARLWDLRLAAGTLPESAGSAWRAVDHARRGDLARAWAEASDAVDSAPYEARGYQARAAVAAFACDEQAEREALALERFARGAFVVPDDDPRIAREFTYREVGLAASQPPGALLDLRVERWPWSLVDRPECSS